MLCLQQVERFTLEGAASRSRGKGGSFSLAWKGKRGVGNQIKPGNWCGTAPGPVQMVCCKLRGFSCIMMTWSLFQVLQFLLYSPSFGLGKVQIPAVNPLWCSTRGIQAGWTNSGQTLCFFHSFCAWDTNTASEKTLGVVELSWCGFKVRRHLRNYTLKQFYCPAWPLKKKENLKMAFYETHDLFSLLFSACCLLIANLVVSKEMLKEQFSLMLMQGKYFQHCYTM